MNFSEYILQGKSNLNKEIFIGRGLRYSELYKIIKNNLLNKFDKIKGELIGICLDNSEEFIISYLSILKSKNTAVLFEKGLPEERYFSLLKKFKINYFITNSLFHKKTISDFYSEKINKNLIKSENVLFYLRKKKILSPNKNLKKVAVVIFTSGSTGEKKGVMLTHENLIHNTNSILKVLPIGKKDKVNLLLPPSYSFGLSVINTHLKKGAEIYIHNSPFVGSLINELKKFKCNSFYGVPSTFEILLEKTDFMDHKFPYIKYAAQAGGNLNIDIKRKILSKFKNKFYVMYGATEASPRLSYVPARKLKDKIKSIGIPIPGVKFKLFKQKKTSLYELGVAGKNIMKGYLNEETLTKKSFKGNFFLTGDLGYKDKENFFFINKRADKTIKRYGFKVNLSLLESKVKKIRIVRDCKIFVNDNKKLILIVQVRKKDKKYYKSKNLHIELKKYFTTYEIPDEILLTDKILNSFNKKTSIENLYQGLNR